MRTFTLGVNTWNLLKGLLGCSGITGPPSQVLLLRVIDTSKTVNMAGRERWVESQSFVIYMFTIGAGVEVVDTQAAEDLPNGIIYMTNNTQYDIEYWAKDSYRETILPGDVRVFVEIGQLTMAK